MISSEVQRTLVKSPPELWAELSNPAALARHLGELGDIRITRAEPEKRVEWETEVASGTVLIKPSGWGTKVTLSVRREITTPVPETSDIEQTDIDQGEGDVASTAESVEPDMAELESEQTSGPEAAAAAEVPETTIELKAPREPAPQPAPRRGFLARLFGRRQPTSPEPVEGPPQQSEAEALTDIAPIHPAQPEADEATIAKPGPSGSAIESLQARFRAEPASEPLLEADPEPEPEPVAAQAERPAKLAIETDEPSEDSLEGPSGPTRDLAGELKAAEEAAAEEVTAVLTAVLDRLGAAHHRPFSRA